MFGESDARSDDLGSGEPLEVAEELDPMDAEPGTNPNDGHDVDVDVDVDVDDTVEAWEDSDDQPDDASDPDIEAADDEPHDVTAGEDEDASTAEVPFAPIDATPDAPTPPVTGDQAVDEAMMRLAESQAGSFAERIESGEHAHRSLQSRLGGLGGA